MSARCKILNVANKRLPDHDYRIQYRLQTDLAQVVYGLPGKPASISDDEYVCLGFGEGIGVADLKNFVDLARYLREPSHRIDLVHFFSTKLQLLGPLVAKLCGIPAVCTITGFGRTFNRTELKYRLLRPLYLLLLRMTLKLSQAVYFQNRGDMNWVVSKFPKYAHKLHWIGSGVQAEVAPRKNFQEETLGVLMVARVMKDKGIETFLDAARQLHGSGFRFELVGPPSVGQDELLQEVQDADRAGVLEYFGELDQQELLQRYRSNHIFAFPSHGEGMPRVMLEAGHALLCPLASDIPAHQDLVHEGGGFIIDGKASVDSLVAHLKLLQNDRHLLEAHALNYQSHIVDNFSVTAYSDRMDAFLSGLLSLELPQSGDQKIAA